MVNLYISNRGHFAFLQNATEIDAFAGDTFALVLYEMPDGTRTCVLASQEDGTWFPKDAFSLSALADLRKVILLATGVKEPGKTRSITLLSEQIAERATERMESTLAQTLRAVVDAALDARGLHAGEL